MRDLNRSPHKLISDDPRGMIRGHGGRNGQREGWMSDCSGGGGGITRTEGGKEGWL